MKRNHPGDLFRLFAGFPAGRTGCFRPATVRNTRLGVNFAVFNRFSGLLSLRQGEGVLRSTHGSRARAETATLTRSVLLFLHLQQLPHVNFCLSATHEENHYCSTQPEQAATGTPVTATEGVPCTLTCTSRPGDPHEPKHTS